MLVLAFFAALGAALLTFFTGFGLGTLLMPVLAFFVPLPQAIALTAAVHLVNNLGVAFLIGPGADRKVLWRFGVPAVLAAFAGAAALNALGEGPQLRQAIGVTIAVLGVLELGPWLQQWSLNRRWLPLGGAISGFLGGLSGHQGALRSAFLMRLHLKPQTYLATGVLIGCAVDVARLLLYGRGLKGLDWQAHAPLLLACMGGALAGAFGGKILLPKLTLPYLRRIVGAALVLFGVALAVGVI